MSNFKPTYLHEVKGTYQKEPHRRRAGEPVPKAGIGEPPSHLGEHEQAVWHELVGIAPEGVLGDSDRLCVELTARLIVKSRRDPENFTGANERNLFTLLSKMGLSPADRMRVPTAQPDDQNEFDDL